MVQKINVVCLIAIVLLLGYSVFSEQPIVKEELTNADKYIKLKTTKNYEAYVNTRYIRAIAANVKDDNERLCTQIMIGDSVGIFTDVNADKIRKLIK